MKKIVYLIVFCILILFVSCKNIKKANEELNDKIELNQKHDLTHDRFFSTYIETINGHEYIIVTKGNSIDIEHSESCPCYEKNKNDKD